MQKHLKLALVAASISVLSACGGGGGDEEHSFFSVDNLNIANGVVCVQDLFILDSKSEQGQQVARDLVDYYGTYNFNLRPIHAAYAAPTYCGGPTSNFVPAPGVILSAAQYYNIIVPAVR